MKTLQPLILTARIASHDLAPFDQLRREHFPPDRNILQAHLTMFHRLPGEHRTELFKFFDDCAAGEASIKASVTGVRHLGAGVAFVIECERLVRLRASLRSMVAPWLGGQDMQKWQPHITVQNKVERSQADGLYHQLRSEFEPSTILIEGLDLWQYLNGPWRFVQTFRLAGDD